MKTDLIGKCLLLLISILIYAVFWDPICLLLFGETNERLWVLKSHRRARRVKLQKLTRFFLMKSRVFQNSNVTKNLTIFGYLLLASQEGKNVNCVVMLPVEE